MERYPLSVQPPPISESSFGTAAEWGSWLTETVANLLESHRVCPDHIASGYHRERTQAREYRGRELLELLQNADDAAEPGRPAKVLLRLEPEGLLVANTGSCFFSVRCRIADVPRQQPKASQQEEVHRKQGVGVRSVLSWSPGPSC